MVIVIVKVIVIVVVIVIVLTQDKVFHLKVVIHLCNAKAL